eukprot:gene49855-29877_t
MEHNQGWVLSADTDAAWPHRVAAWHVFDPQRGAWVAGSRTSVSAPRALLGGSTSPPPQRVHSPTHDPMPIGPGVSALADEDAAVAALFGAAAEGVAAGPDAAAAAGGDAGVAGRLSREMEVYKNCADAQVARVVDLQQSLKGSRETVTQLCGVLSERKEGLKRRLLGSGADPAEWAEQFLPADPLSQQSLEVLALDRALEDLLYALDTALRRGVISAQVYVPSAQEQ